MLSNRALAPTTFLAGPDEKLATADVYEIHDDSVINNLPVPAALDADNFANELRGGKTMLASLPMLSGGDIKVASSSLLSSAKSSAGGLVSSLKDMGSKVYNALGGVNGVKTLLNSNGSSLLNRVSSGTLGIPGLANTGLTSLSTVLNNKNTPLSMQALLSAPINSQLGAFATTNNVTSKLAPGNLTQSYQFSSLLNNIVPAANQVNVVDKDSAARLITAFAVGGMSTGVPNAFSSVMPLANNDTAILARAGQVALSYASGTGNIHGMKDVVNAVGSANLVSMGKTVFSNFSKNFQSDASTAIKPTSRAKEDFQTVTETFHKLDPDWLHAPVKPSLGYDVVDLSTGFEGSQDFKNMMAAGAKTTEDSELKCFAMTKMFDIKPPEEALQSQFPLTYTTIKTTTSPNTQTMRDKDGWLINADGVRIADLPSNDLGDFTEAQIDAMNKITIK